MKKWLSAGLATALALCPTFAYAIVGSEDINEETLYRFRRAHEKDVYDEREKKEEEKILAQIRIAEEKKEALRKGAVEAGEGKSSKEEQKKLSEEEQKKLANEITKLQIELLPKKKRWRDRVKVAPFVRTTYDSNLQHQPKHQSKYDVFTDTGGAIQTELGTAKTQADIDYRGAYETHFHQTKESRWEHAAAAELGYDISQKTKMTGYYRFAYTAGQTSEIRSLSQRIINDLGTSLNYRLSKKTGVRMRVDYRRQDFTKPQTKSSSSSEVQFGPEFDYYLSDKTALFGRYAIGFSNGGLDGSNKAVANDIRAGIKGKILPKTSVLIDMGATAQKNTGSLSGWNSEFSGEAIVIYDLTPKTRAELFMNRNFNQAVQTAGSTFYSTTNFGLRFFSKFTRRFMGQLETSLRRNRYATGGTLSSSGEHDTIIYTLFRLQYEIRQWFLVGLQYRLDLATSNKKQSEYTAHQVSLDLIGKF
jgi:hypothetical protein